MAFEGTYGPAPGYDNAAAIEAGIDRTAEPFFFAIRGIVRSRLRERTGAVAMVLSQGDVTLDILARRTTVAGREVDLSAREFALAEQFLRHPGTVLTREVLLSRIWGMDFDPGSNVVDVYVRYLRAKLGADHIVTVRGEGYRWE